MSNLYIGHSIDDSYQVSVVAMFAKRSGRNEQSSQRTFHRCFLPCFGSFGQAVSEEKTFFNRPIRNKNCLWRPCLVMDQNKMCTLQRGPSIDASYQVSVHLVEGFQRRRLLEAQWAEPVSFTFHSALRNLIQNLPQVLPTKYRFILAKQFQIRRFSEIDQSKSGIACGSHVCK